MKKFIKAAAVLCILLLAVACQPGPESGIPKADTEAKYLKYAEEGDGMTILGYSGTSPNVKIPETIEGKPVLKIGDRAFAGNKTIVSLTLPSSLRDIGEAITYGCSNITELEIAEKPATRAIDDAPVFESSGNCIIRIDGMQLVIGCKTSLIPEEVKSVGSWAFQGVEGLETLVLGAGIEKIEDFAFRNCPDLEKTVFGASVKEIGYAVFAGCSNMAEISVSPLNENFKAEGNAVMAENETDRILVAGCAASEIPEGTTVIGEGAFQSVPLKEIYIPQTVRTIKKGAFQFTPITHITIPAGVTLIEFSAFGGCSDLESIEVAEGNTAYRAENSCLIDIGKATVIHGFKNCTEIPAGVKAIGYRSFRWIPLKDKVMVIPEGVEEIGDGAFSNTKLAGAELPKSLKKIGSNIFEGCEFIPEYPEELNWTKELDGEGENAFYTIRSYNGTSETVVVPADFYDIPVKTIGSHAFNGRGIKSISIPASVTWISEGAFSCLKDLETLTVDSANKNYKVETGAIFDVEAKTVLGGTRGCRIPEGTVRIGNEAFKETMISTLVLPASLKEIGSVAFDCIETLKEVDIPASVEKVGASAFGPHPDSEPIITVHFAKDHRPEGWDEAWHDGGNPEKVVYSPALT